MYNYTHKTKHVTTVYSVAAVPYLQSVLHVMLFRMLNMFCTFTSALPAVCVQCPIWLFFCISLISYFPGMLFRYCMSDFETVPVNSVTASISFLITFHMRWISIVRILCSKYFLLLSLSQFYLPKFQCLLAIIIINIIIIIIDLSLLSFCWEIFTYPVMQQSTALGWVVLFVV